MADIKTVPVTIILSAEHRDFSNDISACFEDQFQVDAGLMRNSLGDLPMQIMLWIGSAVASGIAWDIIKAGIGKVRERFSNARVTIDYEGIMFAVRTDGTVLPIVVPELKEKYQHITNLDQLIAYICSKIHNRDIQEEWTETTLGGVASNIAYGYTESASLEKLGPKFLRITDIQDDFIDWETVPYCPISEKDHSKYKLEIGDVVIARTGNSTGATATIKQEVDAVFASYLIRFRVDPKKADYNFIDFLLRSEKWRGFVKSVKGGSAQGGANAQNFAGFPVLLPSLPEQQAIARILSSFDDKIELLREQNETLEKTAQTIFQEWFGKYDIEDELPDRWRVGRLGDEFDITIGRTPPRIEQEWFSETPLGKKWISIKDIGNSKTYIFETSEYLTDEAIKKFNIPVIPSNTTILSFKMTVGKLTITTEEMLSNEAIAHLKIKDNFILSTEFIYCYLQKLDFNSLGSTSSIVTAINSTMIKELKVIVPDIERVREFDKSIKPIFQKIHNNLSQIGMLSKTRDELLPRLMSGEVRVEI